MKIKTVEDLNAAISAGKRWFTEIIARSSQGNMVTFLTPPTYRGDSWEYETLEYRFFKYPSGYKLISVRLPFCNCVPLYEWSETIGEIIHVENFYFTI